MRVLALYQATVGLVSRFQRHGNHSLNPLLSETWITRHGLDLQGSSLLAKDCKWMALETTNGLTPELFLGNSGTCFLEFQSIAVLTVF